MYFCFVYVVFGDQIFVHLWLNVSEQINRGFTRKVTNLWF